MPTDTQIINAVAEIVCSMGLSPQQRFSLGTALICECAEEANRECGPNSPFFSVEMNHENPFRTASDLLAAYCDYSDAKKAEQAAAPEVMDEGRAEKVDSILAEGRAAVRAESEGLEQDKVEQVKVQVEL